MMRISFIVLAVFLSFGAAWAALVINEIMPAPATDWNGDGLFNYRDDEWVEIYNPAGVPVDLTGYRIADGEPTWRYELTGTIPPHGFLVVFGSDSYAWEKATGFPAYGLSLNNTGDTVRLFRLAPRETVLVDCYSYNKYEGGPERSTGRIPDGSSEWLMFDSLNPYSGQVPPLGSGCPPTPGETNGCPNAVEGVTWGKIKSLYR
ncbi:MAG: lamin tail domain-containing protein [Candidatus Eisenbacteria bacterium]|nr:lamin tail domain-containing protein [Candidatus Eisenbacteria bacterium]